MKLVPTLSILLVLLVLASSALAVQTAFWRPYTADQYTYALIHFDADNPTRAEGKCGAGEIVGQVAFDPNGKFGGAVRLDGQGVVKFMPAELFPGGRISIEAWVKLTRYPENEACVVFKPAIVDANPQYDPKVDRAHGFALIVDSKGALHFQVTNTFYGYTIRTSSAPGVVPLNQWVHLAGGSGGLGSYRRVYLNGRELAAIAVEWGQGLWGEEKEATPIYVGNNDKGTAGVSGLIDEVRIHTAILKLWEPEDLSWAQGLTARPIPAGPPYFLPGHVPTCVLPLDGTLQPTLSRVTGLKVEGKPEGFVPAIRGQGFQGPLTLSADPLVDLREGSLEFWFQPIGVTSFTDFCAGFMTMEPANLYIYNTGVISNGVLPLSLYFYRDGKPVFVSDGLGTELHEGAWYHTLITWKGKEITLYVNGQEAGRNPDADWVINGSTACRRIAFAPTCQVDELTLYDKALTAEEAANCYFRYRDPKQLKPVKLLSVKTNAGYLPSSGTIYYTLTPQIPAARIAKVRLTLTNDKEQTIFTREVPFVTAEQQLRFSDLPDGTYTLAVSTLDAENQAQEGQPFTFERKHFPWEKNTLGITDGVYPPFKPVEVDGNRVKVVLRELTMNHFGLWDRVVSEGRDLLAGPMRLRYETAAGEGQWTASHGGLFLKRPSFVVYSAEASAPPITVKTASEIEVDGCMRVTVALEPGTKPEEIRRLWLDIPLKASETPLFHEVTDGLRQNVSGATPPGTGVVWDGSKAVRYSTWQNDFVCYLWLGGETRGLAWFAENDKGWLTAKVWATRESPKLPPIQEIVREGDQVILRVYLCNTPTTLTKRTELNFGLQASPTKPLPEGWRLKLADIPGGLPVVPWGGLHCAYQTPYHDDWSIVDKIVEARATKKVDTAWFEAYAKEHNPPPAFGNWPWLSSVEWFANRCAALGPDKPITCYQEEMGASTVRPEWRVFQDEWRPEAIAASRACPDESVFRQGREVSPGAGTTFIESYRDFGVYVANEWLKRGVSLYWDNTFPHVSWNPRTTAAYVTETGAIQPCIIIWNQRDYQHRVWNLLQQWRAQRPEPLEYVLHMTNTLLLPVHTWGTADLDHEFSSTKPFTPEWLRTETTGRQIGNYGLSLYAVAGDKNPLVTALPDDARDRVEWGLRVVHEIQHPGKLDHFLTDFGYGTDAVQVINYWSEKPPLTVSNAQVKWLALYRPAEKRLLLVLASWSDQPAEATVALTDQLAGLSRAAPHVTDAETGDALPANATGAVKLSLPAPYGVRILKIEG